jgi:hypothetical protein
LRETDPDDFLAGDVRVTVETDVVDSVVVASVSVVTAGAWVAVEEALAVSAAELSVRAHAVAIIIAERAPASDRILTDPFPEQSAAPWVCGATVSPTPR